MTKRFRNWIILLALAGGVIWLSLPKKELVLDLGNNVAMKLRSVPGGETQLGSPESEKGRYFGENQNVVYLEAFFMGQTPVTVDQFRAFIQDSGYKTEAEKDNSSLGFEIKNGNIQAKNLPGCSWQNPGFSQEGNHPVVQVTWNDARAFCDWLSKRSRKKVALPSEAQWECACRAHTSGAYLWGDNPDDGKGWANCADQTLAKTLPRALQANPGAFFAWDDGFAFTSPVATFKANAFGLYDMTGNVSQWCENDYAQGESGLRVLRGGSWNLAARDSRVASRAAYNPAFRYATTGFRVVLN